MAGLDEALDYLDLQAWLEQYTNIKVCSQSEIRIQTCPKCGNEKFKLYVHLEKRVWYCFVCSWGKHLQDPCMLMADVSGRHIHDVRMELIQTVVPTPAGDLTAKLQSLFGLNQAVRCVQITAQPVDLPGNVDFSGLIGTQVYRYAISRGLTADDICRLELRCSYKLRNYTGPFLIFPFFYKSEPVGWQGRRVIGDAEPKYVSCDDVSDWLWPLGGPWLDVLRSADRVVLVEGVFDAMGLWRTNQPALCTFGKKISTRQEHLLLELGIRRLVLAWDLDASTRRSTSSRQTEIERVVEHLKSRFEVYVVDLDQVSQLTRDKKVDPGEILRTPELGTWFAQQIDCAMDARSPEYFRWRLQRY